MDNGKDLLESKEPHNLTKFDFKVSKNSTTAAAILKATQQPGRIIMTSFRATWIGGKRCESLTSHFLARSFQLTANNEM